MIDFNFMALLEQSKLGCMTKLSDVQQTLH